MRARDRGRCARADAPRPSVRRGARRPPARARGASRGCAEPHHVLVDALLSARDEQTGSPKDCASRPATTRSSAMRACIARRSRPRSLVEEATARDGVGHDHLRGLRRRRRASVGGKVDERDVDLVTDGAHHRNAARGDVPHELLVVEREEVVSRAASAPHHDDVDVIHLLQHPQRAPDRLGRARPLHQRRREEDARAAAAEGDLAHVVDDRAARARDHADDARVVRERPLLLGREEPLGPELLLQLLERLEERAFAGGLHAIADELQLAARRPVRRLSTDTHARAVLDERAASRRDLRAIEHDVDRRLFVLVLHAEVDVPARRGAGAAHLSFHPELARERTLERAPDGAPELCDGEDARLRTSRRGGPFRQRRRSPRLGRRPALDRPERRTGATTV